MISALLTIGAVWLFGIAAPVGLFLGRLLKREGL